MIPPDRRHSLFARLLFHLTLTLGIPALLLFGAASAFLDRIAERRTLLAMELPWETLHRQPELLAQATNHGLPFLDPNMTLSTPAREVDFLDTLPPTARSTLDLGTPWSGVLKPLGRPAMAVRLGPHPTASNAFLMVRAPIPSGRAFAGELLSEMIWILAVLGILSLGLTMWVLYVNLRPLKSMSVQMRRMFQDEAPGELETLGIREYRDLAGAMDEARDHYGRVMAEMTSARERLLAILSQTQERVAVLDQEGKILYANPSLTRMFDMGPERSRPPFHWECLRHPPLQEELEAFLRSLRRPPVAPRQFQLTYESRHYQGSLSHLVRARGALLTLSDITEAVNLADTKRHLVANVSHELNTPLTSIKGFSETLEAGETDPDRLAQWAILKRNTDRLIALVKDLLTLSRLEQGGLPQHRESVAVAKWLQDLHTLMEPKAKAKGLALSLQVADDLPPLWADPFQLEQVGVNLLDNALKYSDRGMLRIEAQRIDDAIVLRFRDSGPGIPAGQEEKIFERFHVVDPSRSRQLGGTGLGLSIVKHIVLAHGGTITAENHPEGGAVFTVTLPHKGDDHH